MESAIVTLGLHIQSFDLPFFVKEWTPLRYVFVDKHISELIKSKIWNFVFVSLEPIDHIGSHDVIVGSIMRC